MGIEGRPEGKDMNFDSLPFVGEDFVDDERLGVPRIPFHDIRDAAGVRLERVSAKRC